MVSSKYLQTVEGYWTCTKEVLGWTVDTEAVKVALLEQKIQDLLTLLAISETQRCIGQKELEHLVGKI